MVRPPVLPACFPYPCARLTAGHVTTLWAKHLLSVSQQGRLSLPSLRWLTGAVWPTVGSPPRPVCAGCGRWPFWPVTLVSDESALQAAWPLDHRPDRRPYGVRDDALYKLTFFTFTEVRCFCMHGAVLCLSVAGKSLRNGPSRWQRWCACVHSVQIAQHPVT